jgi:hypothetical protein
MTIQETWQPGNEEFEKRGFLVIIHNYKVKPKQDGKREGRDMRGVAIIWSPWFKRAYERACRQPPIY